LKRICLLNFVANIFLSGQLKGFSVKEDLGFWWKPCLWYRHSWHTASYRRLCKMELLKDPKWMKSIAEYDRPREKLHGLGAGSLSMQNY
jgi:hypothetical protein